MSYFGWGTAQVALRDHEGGWWIATGEGLCRFPRVSSIEQLSTSPVKRVYTRKDGLPGDDVFRLFEDSRGDIWITTLGGDDADLSRWDRRTDTIHRYSSANHPGVPTAYAEDRAGNLWIGISNEVSTHRASGLLRYRDGQFDPFIDAGAIGWIPALYVDRSGKLLIGSTDGGLIQVAQPAGEHPQLASYATASALSSISVRCMVEDLLGRLYVGTPRGVDRIEPESTRVRHYTIGNGLAGGTPNSMVRDRKGRIWVGTSLGLSMMVPSPDQPVPSPRIYITGLSVNGEPRSVAQAGVERIAGLRLDPSQTQLRIDFVGVGGASGELLQYQYKLEGVDSASVDSASVDSAWSAPSIQRVVSYERLTPGHFRFAVRPVLAGAVVESATAEVGFELLPPVWRRSWFLTLAIAVFSALAWLAHRYDLSRRLELERMRLRIARDLHDDLGASLTRMTILTELASREARPQNPKAGGDLSRIAEMARGMVDALGELVWAVDPRRDDMASTSRRIRRYATDVLEPLGIAWTLEISDPGFPPLTPEQRRHVLLIFQEALRNAARHSHCSRVELFLRVEADEYVVRIRDNGCGLPDPIPELGSGLLNLRSRAAALGGGLSIVSSPGAGSDLTVRFPAGKAGWRMGRMFMLFRERPGVRSNRR
jgi:signal transduction histidine kinase